MTFYAVFTFIVFFSCFRITEEEIEAKVEAE